MVEPAVPGHRPGDLEAGRPQQTDVLEDLPLQRDHHLGGQQTVVAGAATRRVGDVVPEEVVRADRDLADAERRAGVVGVEDEQGVGHHRPGANAGEQWVVVRHHHAEVRPGLLDVAEPVPDPTQVVDDRGAVSEEEREERPVTQQLDHPLSPVVEAVQRIDLARMSRRFNNRGAVATMTKPMNREIT